MSVRETTGNTFDEVMNKKAIEVLTLATYIMDKVKLISAK